VDHLARKSRGLGGVLGSSEGFDLITFSGKGHFLALTPNQGLVFSVVRGTLALCHYQLKKF
jgi:hypothetical protein